MAIALELAYRHSDKAADTPSQKALAAASGVSEKTYTETRLRVETVGSVWGLVQVWFGSVRFGSVRFGSVWFGLV